MFNCPLHTIKNARKAIVRRFPLKQSTIKRRRLLTYLIANSHCPTRFTNICVADGYTDRLFDDLTSHLSNGQN